MFVDYKILINLLDDNYTGDIELYCNNELTKFQKHSYFPYNDNIYFFMIKSDRSSEHIYVYELIPNMGEVNLINNKEYLTELKEAYLKHFNIEVNGNFKGPQE